LNTNDRTQNADIFQVGLIGATRPSVTKKKGPSRDRRGHRPSSLRPPTLMIDLLFGALMLFAFQMGDPNARQVQTHDIELPAAADKNETKPARVRLIWFQGQWRAGLVPERTNRKFGGTLTPKATRFECDLTLEPCPTYMNRDRILSINLSETSRPNQAKSVLYFC
jgi:hypothetical protein